MLYAAIFTKKSVNFEKKLDWTVKIYGSIVKVIYYSYKYS